MSLSKYTLANLMYAEIENEFGYIRRRDEKYVRRLCRALSEAIVTHVTTSAEVNITTGTSGLQQIDDPDGLPGEKIDTLAPSSTKTLSID